jgi:beta-xylosidase
MRHLAVLVFILLACGGQEAQSQPWIPDLGDGTYRNPVIHADYSDPDVVAVGRDFYMVSSSFNCVPGLPVLHSRDLVNWKIVNHIFVALPPDSVFSFPQHGKGCWAPSLRYHDSIFYVFFGDPDYGIYMSRTRDPLGTWEPLKRVRSARGWIDPCPLWDEDGRAYLVHAFAGSRSGMKSVLAVHRMKADGTGLLGEAKLVYDGHGVNPTIEGPKFYKRKGYYYIFAPAGGVKPGWQTVLRSRDPFGPYEIRTVMHQGGTNINGPHQGGWVELENGESWFLHFQDLDAYGRVVHLNPVRWVEDWPVIGVDGDGDGIGEPVREYPKPGVKGAAETSVPQTSDEFDGPAPGLQWQWHANSRQEWMFLSGNRGYMRLYCMLRPDGWKNHWDSPNLYLQKFPAPVFEAVTKMQFRPRMDGDAAGLIIMGMDYATLQLEQKEGEQYVSQVLCMDAEGGGDERTLESHAIASGEVWLKVKVSEGAACEFSYSTDGKNYRRIGEGFEAAPGKWIGAKVGLWAGSVLNTNDKGYTDVDWFRVR